jgi:hypothetical protein
MALKDYEQRLDAMFRLHGAVWFSILEAAGPEFARRAIDNMRDLGLLYSDNPYCEHLCNRLADAEISARSATQGSAARH